MTNKTEGHVTLDLKALREKAERALKAGKYSVTEVSNAGENFEVFDYLDLIKDPKTILQLLDQMELLDTYRIAFEQMADDVLSSIAGFTETPVEGYKKAPWLVAGDLKRLTDQVERERQARERLEAFIINVEKTSKCAATVLVARQVLNGHDVRGRT